METLVGNWSAPALVNYRFELFLKLLKAIFTKTYIFGSMNKTVLNYVIIR